MAEVNTRFSARRVGMESDRWRGRVAVSALCAAGLMVTACSQARTDRPEAEARAQLFEGMGPHHRAITTSSPEAQHYFDQALVWAFAFNHDEAIRSFEQAARLDPDCAPACWGAALCHGPHINNPVMPPERVAAAWSALQRAQERRANAAPVEQALIDALAKRYVAPAAAGERGPLDRAYADAMRAVWKQYPDDADVGVLFAESLMDLQPWDLWTPAGEPKGVTNEVLEVLETVLARWPEHPGACHLYIHAVESSPHPERADAAAKRLRTAVPIAGHLVHMPAHIDVQLGRWALAADQNQAAIKADQRYRAVSPRQGFYRLYMAHNHHFLAFAAMMEGNSAGALQAARDMLAGIPESFVRDPQQAPLLDPYMMIELDVLKRFGRWDELLKQPRPPKTLPITTAFWHYARGIAYAAKHEVPAAEREQRQFRALVEKIPADQLMAINSAHQVLDIADHMLTGEIALARAQTDAAVAALEAAVREEDKLRYIEPPEWIQPARHTLGAVLVDAKRYAEAEQVYRQDLEIWPENGWSLHGLATCLRARGADAEAEKVETRFKKVWARADMQIGSSCLCVKGTDGT